MFLVGCYDAHMREDVESAGCPTVSPFCVTQAHPCDAKVLVPAVCEIDQWHCPEGIRVFQQPWSDTRCLPLFGVTNTVLSDGVHEGPVPVSMGDRCAWVFPSNSETSSLIAVDVGSSCASLGPVHSVAPRTTQTDYFAIQAAFQVGSHVRVLQRGWRFDATVPLGVRSIGVGFGVATADAIGTTAWTFETEAEDLGDAAVVHDGFLYAYGCPGTPTWLVEDCIVGRAPLDSIDIASRWRVLGRDGWGEGEHVRVFGSGPHRGSVVHDPRGGFLHTFIAGFGASIEMNAATQPEGPWSEARTLAACELPSDDSHAYCAGPVVHLELFDPTRPNEIYVGYSVGSTATDSEERRRRNPQAYWPRVVRLSR